MDVPVVSEQASKFLTMPLAHSQLELLLLGFVVLTTYLGVSCIFLQLATSIKVMRMYGEFSQ